MLETAAARAPGQVRADLLRIADRLTSRNRRRSRLRLLLVGCDGGRDASRR